jgi:hypothetical protein
VRLEARREEIEQALLARVYGIADPTESGDHAYIDGFRGAAAAAVDFSLATLESSRDDLPLVPPVLLSQARRAAHNGVGLDTVLRRYTAGYALLVDFLVEEFERDGTHRAPALRRMLATGSSAFDLLLAAVGEEHARELQGRLNHSHRRRHADRVNRLLAGELIDTTELSYELSGWHVSVVAQGVDAESSIRGVADELSCRVLTVAQPEGRSAGWLGARQAIDVGQVVCAFNRQAEMSVGIGEAGEGLTGWRLSHRQAVAALSTMRTGARGPVRYADAALLASAKADELLSTSLRMLFLGPLDLERDRGKVARETLRAYFKAERNVSSAAAILGVKRHTVTKRLRMVEERLGKTLSKFSPEVELALRVEEFDSPTVAAGPARHPRASFAKKTDIPTAKPKTSTESEPQWSSAPAK